MKNIFSAILNIITSLIVGVYVPKLFLEFYGPSLHGCLSTANNMGSYVLLLTAGLTTAAVQALYAPMASGNHRRVSEVYNAINVSYKSVSLYIFLGFLLLAVIMPLIIGNEVSFILVGSIYILLGIQYLIDNLWLRQYIAIIQSDDKIAVVNNLNTVSYILQAIIQILIIKQGYSILVFQSVPIVVIIVKFILLQRFVKQHYSFIDYTIEGDRDALKKKKNAFIHQLSGLVLFNTDIFLLTLACNQVEVSIYVIYNLVFIHIYSFLIQTCSTALVANIGRRFVNEESKSFERHVALYELVYRVLVFVIFTTSAVVLIPFISLYTGNVIGVDYVNKTYGILFIVANMLSALRVPSMTIVDAIGHYKETQNQAIIEASINFAISLILVWPMGIIGLLIGTLSSFLYRTFAMIHYEYRSILHKKASPAILINIILVFWVIIVFFSFNGYWSMTIRTWGEWLMLSAVTTTISFLGAILVCYILNKESMICLYNKLYFSVICAIKKK